MAVSVDGFSKKRLRLFPHLPEPVSGNQFARIRVGIGKRKNTSSEIFECLECACIIYNQVRVIKMTVLNLRCGHQLKSIFFLADDIGARTDKGQINLAFGQQFIDLPVGFTLNKLDFTAHFIANVIQQLPVVDKGFLG